METLCKSVSGIFKDFWQAGCARLPKPLIFLPLPSLLEREQMKYTQ